MNEMDPGIPLDEARILRLSASPPADLFPVLHRDGAFMPLITLLAVLPALFAVWFRPFDEAAAAWGIRAIEMAATVDPQSWIDPSGLDIPESVRWATPLVGWLSALVLEIPFAAKRGGLFVIPYLSSVGLLLVLFAMWRWFAGHRFAFWVAIIAAFHGPFLQMAQDPAPQATTLLLAVAAAGTYLRHALRRRDGYLSWMLLVSGILLGLCSLAGGGVAVLLFAILLGWTLWQSLGHRIGDARHPGLAVPHALVGLAVLALTAFAVGGWWPAMMFSRHGMVILASWVLQMAPASSAVADASPAMRLGVVGAKLLSIAGLLIWPALLGVFFTLRHLFESDDEKDLRTARLLWIWTGAGMIYWLPATWNAAGIGTSAAVWDGLILIPCLGFAAAGLEVISRGRVGLAVAAILAVGTVIVGFPLANLPDWAHAAASGGMWFIMAALAAALGIGWWLREGLGERDRLMRWAVSVLALAPLGANAFSGIQAVERRGPNERALASIRALFPNVPHASQCIVIDAHPGPLPLRLEYVLRSQWVGTEFSEAPSWDIALQRVLAHPPTADRPLVVVDWSQRGTRPNDFRLSGLNVEQLRSGPVFADRVVQAYVVSPRSNDGSSQLAGATVNAASSIERSSPVGR